ncbi:DNA-binding protein [Paraburkholderia sp. MPAMCS5]|uniref:DNA-binding protein n=1 Tax=Paraburkholderia sp. MPAMCS5 TaxID=3112563 RepID=UPI002E19D3F9|nr:DNA-binding protein [Paraburkholderia sp. MPAMCS5]
MARPAAVTPDQIRTTVLAMLAEAGDAETTIPATSVTPATPVTRDRFRRAVSVRRLRARLGAGDPTVLSRALNAIEAELVQAGLTEVALPGLPDAIADQMRALWAAAVSVQLDDVVRLKAEARDAMEAAQGARHDADLRVELLRVELAELRAQLSARDTELATARTECRAATATLAEREQAAAALRQSAEQATQALEDARTDHAAALAAVHARYEGLSKRLLQETEHQRHALAAERERLSKQFADAQTRITALEGLRERLLEELATGRDAHRQAAAEAAALATVVAEQRHALQALQALQALPAAHATQVATHKRPARHPPARHMSAGHAAAVAAAPRPRPRSPRARKSPSS